MKKNGYVIAVLTAAIGISGWFYINSKPEQSVIADTEANQATVSIPEGNTANPAPTSKQKPDEIVKTDKVIENQISQVSDEPNEINRAFIKEVGILGYKQGWDLLLDKIKSGEIDLNSQNQATKEELSRHFVAWLTADELAEAFNFGFVTPSKSFVSSAVLGKKDKDGNYDEASIIESLKVIQNNGLDLKQSFNYKGSDVQISPFSKATAHQLPEVIDYLVSVNAAPEASKFNWDYLRFKKSINNELVSHLLELGYYQSLSNMSPETINALKDKHLSTYKLIEPHLI